MARLHHRVFALTLAVVFFITAFGFSFLVIYELTHQNSSPTSSSTTNNSSSKKLAGTPLANFTPVASVPTLQSIDSKTGTGATVKAGQTITVQYTGAVASTGTIFQSSLDTGQPATLNLSQVITGWQKGIPGMRVGGTRRLLIPASEAYGANPPAGSNIPPNADLVFDITLLSIGS